MTLDRILIQLDGSHFVKASPPKVVGIAPTFSRGSHRISMFRY
jgi:hypothetical protein